MSGDIISMPGKFEGEHVSVPHFWDAALDGTGEQFDIGYTVYTFIEIDANDRKLFPDLTEYGVQLWERSDGFVCSEWYDTQQEYDAAIGDAYKQLIEDAGGCDDEE